MSNSNAHLSLCSLHSAAASHTMEKKVIQKRARKWNGKYIYGIYKTIRMVENVTVRIQSTVSVVNGLDSWVVECVRHIEPLKMCFVFASYCEWDTGNFTPSQWGSPNCPKGASWYQDFWPTVDWPVLSSFVIFFSKMKKRNSILDCDLFPFVRVNISMSHASCVSGVFAGTNFLS